MRKQAAIVAVGCALSASIVLWSLSRMPPPLPEEAPVPSEAPRPSWLSFEQEPIGCPSAVCQPLVWLLTRQNEDGSWGDGSARLDGRPLGKAGLTALALLPFLGAGYTPISKDVFVFEGGEWRSGDGIRKAVEWLRRDQRDDGTFRSGADETFDQVLAAFALSEIYGTTFLPSWKNAAQLAVDALLKMQKPDGTWEGAGPTAWGIVALHSARLSELTVEASAIERALHSPGFPGHPGDHLARILAKNDATTAAFRILGESRDREASNLNWWYLATLSMWAYGGTQGKEWWDYKPGPEWDRWNSIVREKVVPLFERDGSIRGTSLDDSVLRSSLAQLTLEVYYRYADVFRPH